MRAKEFLYLKFKKSLVEGDSPMFGANEYDMLDLFLGSGNINQIFGNDQFIIMPNSLSFKIADETANYFECGNCGKIHLHRGMGICTKTQCLTELEVEPTGRVNQLRKNN